MEGSISFRGMIQSGLAWRCAVCILLCLGVGGCYSGGDSQVQEQREPHFLMGQKLARQMDYQGAIDAYEKALQVNPRSASAHFELALLCEDKAGDPAAAIYHYQQFLKLCSGFDNKIDAVEQHIVSCKVELAKSVASLAPLSPSGQTNMEKILLENRDLKAQLARWQEYYRAGHFQPSTNVAAQDPPARSTSVGAVGATTNTGTGRIVQLAPGPSSAGRPPVAGSGRTYSVKSGETLVGISRKYGISLNALQAANPGVEPRRLRVGAVLNIPAS